VLVAGLAIAVASLWWRGPVTGTAGSRPIRVELTLPEGVEFYGSARLSPDGRSVLFIGNREGNRQIYRRELDKAGSRALAGTEGALFLAFSRDPNPSRHERRSRDAPDRRR
jgi:Tol biopolymer transport system component